MPVCILLSGHRRLCEGKVDCGLYEASSCAVASLGSLLGVTYVYTNKSPILGFCRRLTTVSTYCKTQVWNNGSFILTEPKVKVFLFNPQLKTTH